MGLPPHKASAARRRINQLAKALRRPDEVRHGLSGGTWLFIGAASAVVMIATGSVIERQRAQIGERRSRWSELLESWE